MDDVFKYFKFQMQVPQLLPVFCVGKQDVFQAISLKNIRLNIHMNLLKPSKAEKQINLQIQLQNFQPEEK